MASPQPSFIWYELMTPDPDAAGEFYGPVVGWKVSADADPDEGGIDYRLIERGDGGYAGGVMKLTEEMTGEGARPGWMAYLYAPDVDARIAAITAEGGKVLMPATDLPVGRFALVADPQGIPIYIMTPTPPEGQPDAASDVFSETEPQHVRWNELSSPDQQGSMDFYARHFGFEFNEKMPMGEMGDYCFIHQQGKMLGAVMPLQDAEQPAGWMFYFGVPSITAAKTAVESHGGQVLMGPHEVPGGDWILVVTDPQGATCGLVGPKGE